MSNAVLTARGLRKSYLSGDRRIEVLRGVNLDVAAGESVSIRGESGSGKSTLLNLLAGLDAPDAGTLAWAGAPAHVDRRALFLGMMFQAFYLIPEIDALADEPTGNLDEHTGDAVIALLLDLCRETGTALVLVTHNVAHAQKTNRPLFLHDGVLK